MRIPERMSANFLPGDKSFFKTQITKSEATCRQRLAGVRTLIRQQDAGGTLAGEFAVEK
jgi:hypothetical protein